MTDRNLRLALITSATYLAATLGATAVIAWMASELSGDGTVGFLNGQYFALLIIGLAAAFIGGYLYRPRLSRSMIRYARTNPDMIDDLVRPICKARLLSRWYGYASAVCLITGILIFSLTGDAYIELICILTAMGSLTLFFSLHYRTQSRQLYRQRFHLS